jgi:RHS repeat-associated protein
VYYLTDVMGSVIGLANQAGQRSASFAYDGFGNLRKSSGTDSATVTGGDFRFQGQWLESESGLYYFRARDYDSKTGLFLSRDAVAPSDQQPESMNPYQFAYQNPLIYSDPSGMFTIVEINASQSIQGILDKVEAYAANAVKDYLVNKVRAVLGELIGSYLGSLIPFNIGSIRGTFKSDPTGKAAGNAFEKFVKDNLCSLFGDSELSDYFWLKPKVTVGGEPVTSGFHCGINKSVSTQKLTLAKGTFSFPDFIIKNGNPMDKSSKGLLIGDFKYSLTTLNRQIENNPPQWQSIVNHAKYINGHQYAPITFFPTLFAGNKKNQATLIENIEKEAVKKNIIVIAVSIS